MKEIKVRLTFTEDCLGTASADKELYSNYIASNAPDAKTREQEIADMGKEEYEEKAMTIFPKMEDGTPFFYDYQIRGFFKDSCAALQRCRAGKAGKPEEFAKESCAMKAYKKIIDGCIFVKERKIPIHCSGEMGVLQRPLRAQTAQGERIALASSETVPADSWIEFTIQCLSDSYALAVLEWLNYGAFRGLGQWRNASYGRFTYKIIE